MILDGLTTKAGTEIALGKFTVLVGANNVGKSQTLRDIHQKMTGGRNVHTVLVQDLKFRVPESFDALLDGLRVEPNPRNVQTRFIRGITSDLASGDQLEMDVEHERKRFDDSGQFSHLLEGNLGRFRVSHLNAESRLVVAKAGPSHDPHVAPPGTLLQAMYTSAMDEGGDVEQQLREAFRDTFGMDVCLDYSGMQQLRLRIAPDFPELPADPRKLGKVIRDFEELDKQGDGFRSFVGVVLSLLLSKGRLVLLDEPEAFLHPAQARRLGQWVAERVQNVAGQVIVATHNAHFLGGIIASGQDVRIYRLNREANTTDFNLIPAEVTTKIATDPVLSSQRVLEAVFHEGVIVCEGDSDRSVYGAVAAKVLADDRRLFVHAQSKHTIPRIVAPLRAACIPVGAICDIDILNSDREFHNVLKSLSPKADFKSLRNLRKSIAEIVEGANEDDLMQALISDMENVAAELRDGKHDWAGARAAIGRVHSGSSKWAGLKKGVASIDDADLRKRVERAITEASKFGLHIVPAGELEGWMDLGARKSVWVVRALERIGKGQVATELIDFVRQAEPRGPANSGGDLVPED